MALDTTFGGPNAYSYVDDAAYRQFVLDRFNVRLTTSTDTSSAPDRGTTLQNNRDIFTVNAVTGKVINAGEESTERGFTAPTTITTGASAGAAGVVIGRPGIYSAELQLMANVTRASEGKLKAVLQSEGSDGSRERMVEAEIDLAEITTLQPYTINLSLRENTLALNDHIFYKIEYTSEASGAFLELNIPSGQLSLTEYVYGRGTSSGVVEQEDSVESQESQLRRAADYMDHLFNYTGTPLNEAQALAFPRTRMTAIPQDVRKAQMYLAYQIYSGDLQVTGGTVNDATTTATVTEEVSLPGGLRDRTVNAKTSTQTEEHLGPNPALLAARHPLVQQLLSPWIAKTTSGSGAVVSFMELG